MIEISFTYVGSLIEDSEIISQIGFPIVNVVDDKDVHTYNLVTLNLEGISDTFEKLMSICHINNMAYRYIVLGEEPTDVLDVSYEGNTDILLHSIFVKKEVVYDFMDE